jgi:hypothetical protein
VSLPISKKGEEKDTDTAERHSCSEDTNYMESQLISRNTMQKVTADQRKQTA